MTMLPGFMADRPGTPVMEARGLGLRFGSTTALHDVSLAVMPGESHALAGRNGAGKSTLVALLTGLHQPGTGSIRFNGQPAPAVADRMAWRQHVACVYQHSTIIGELSVAENLFINRQPLRHGWISWRVLRREARALLDAWQIDVHEDALAGDLTVEARQLVEIARALSLGARFIILDEPTAQLDHDETRRLLRRVHDLQQGGVTFLFISHHLQEIYEICQTVTVLRDARHVVTAPVAQLPRRALIEAMTGERDSLAGSPCTAHAPPAGGEAGVAPVVLALQQACGKGFEGVSLQVRRGEIVGLTGSTSSGRTAVGEAVAGLRRTTAGRILVSGRALPPGDVGAALAHGVGCVPQDRHRQGLVPGQSIAENATMTIMDRLGRFGFVAPARRQAAALSAMRALDVAASGPQQAVSGLSGGNQQKVVMARALASAPDVLVLIDPTAGVDVKSRQALLAVVEGERLQGRAVLLASSELDDLRICDRVLVMSHGHVVAELARGWDDGELIASMEGVSLHAH